MKKPIKKTGKIDLSKIPKGHLRTTRGSKFGDKRLKRLKTRSNQDRNALDD